MSARPKYQLLPPLSEAEYEALREDIAVQGVLVPIDVDDRGEILDGHHRKQACDELGIECPTRVVDVPDFAKFDYALTVNLARRHLDRAQRRQLVWNSLKDAYHLSDRQHARRCGVSPSTVADVRKDIAAAEQVSNLDTSRTGSDGKVYPPSTKTAAAAAEGSPAAAPNVPEPAPRVERATRDEADGDDRPAPAPDDPEAGVSPTPASGAHDPEAFDRKLDALVPNPNPHAEWQALYLGALAKTRALFRFVVAEVVERGDETCFDELVRLKDSFDEYFDAVQAARVKDLPDNVREIRRPA